MIVDSWVSTKNTGKRNWKKYNFQLSNYGFPHMPDIKTWCEEDPDNRAWGNMGYVSCNDHKDAMMVVLRWG